jgi:hypothetical protein
MMVKAVTPSQCRGLLNRLSGICCIDALVLRAT